MRRLLTTGIKAILSIAALSTAAHWTMRVQREPETAARFVATVSDPVTTGSIGRREHEPTSQGTGNPPAIASSFAQALDQDHLAKLIASASTDRTVRTLAGR